MASDAAYSDAIQYLKRLRKRSPQRVQNQSYGKLGAGIVSILSDE